MSELLQQVTFKINVIFVMFVFFVATKAVDQIAVYVKLLQISGV